MREKELIVYRDLSREEETILSDMAFLMGHFDDEYYNLEDRRGLYYQCIHALLEMAGNHGFYGNLWHCFLAHLLVNNENSYSKACEIVGAVDGSINQAVLHDIVIMKELFDYDFTAMQELLGKDAWQFIEHFEKSQENSKVYNARIQQRICDLACQFQENHTPEEMKNTLTQFYKDYGVGKFGLHKAFRVTKDENQKAQILPITNITHVYMNDLVGYELQKQKLIENTEAFVQGRKANNCLLFGDAGTGKSSSIKAIANEYYNQGLRIIELYKHQFQDLNDVIAQIKNRNYKFIIYMDDLSFEEFEIEYKYLKAVIEGGLEKKPANVLIYATSNRRHLIKETWKDRDDVENNNGIHKSDTIQEKLSLASRFGVTIYFGKPSPKQFQEIVTALANRHGIEMDEKELLAQANKWELSHGGISGRTAQQFIDYLLGKEDYQ